MPNVFFFSASSLCLLSLGERRRIEEAGWSRDHINFFLKPDFLTSPSSIVWETRAFSSSDQSVFTFLPPELSSQEIAQYRNGILWAPFPPSSAFACLSATGFTVSVVRNSTLLATQLREHITGKLRRGKGEKKKCQVFLYPKISFYILEM